MKSSITMFVLMMLGTLVFSSCAQNQVLPKDDELPDVTVPSETEFPLVSVHADWPVYQTADELVNAATNIYTGRVVDMSFEVFDFETGYPDRSNLSDSPYRMLYTVYTVEVSENYKGTTDKTWRVRVVGGTPGVDDRAQYELMENSGLIDKYSGIPTLCEKAKKLTVGESYIFCARRSITGEWDDIINLDQFAFSKDSKSATLIQTQCKNGTTKNTED